MDIDLKHRSRYITDGRDQAPARAMYKAIGFTDDDPGGEGGGLTWTCGWQFSGTTPAGRKTVRSAGMISMPRLATRSSDSAGGPRPLKHESYAPPAPASRSPRCSN